MNTLLQGAKEALDYAKMRNSLRQTLKFNNYNDAANKVDDIIKHKSLKEISDILDLWKQWSNQNQWFDFADRVSERNWYKKSFSSKW